MKKFEAGKTYYNRSICDHECIFTIEVVKRTEKSVTYIYDGKQRRSMIKTDENGEYIKTDRYSMAPTFRAERVYEGLKKYRVKADCLVDEGWVTWENLVKQLAEDIPGYKLGDTREIKRLLAEQLPEWDEEEWEDLRAAVEAESQRIWDKQEKAVTMTREQWNTLTTYLLMSTQHREGEAKAWAELSKEKKEDGSPKYKHAASNAEHWREIVADIEKIRKKIDEG